MKLSRLYQRGEQVVTPDGIGTFADVDDVTGGAIIVFNRRRRSYNPEVLPKRRE
ncbi:MAG: hypothetical protein ACREGH_03760 [Minisyncoccia bacterium]